MSLAGKVVLITGATGTVSRGLTRAFLDAGARPALGVLRSAHILELEREFAGGEQAPMVVPCNLRYEEDVVRLVHRVVHRLGRIDVAINMATTTGPHLRLMDYPAGPWRDVIETNLTGTFLVCREVLPWMIRQGSGSIINATSGPIASAKPESVAHLVSSRGVGDLTRLLATELKGTGVRANMVDTESLRMGSSSDTGQGDWTEAFVWLAGDASAEVCGERIRAVGFSRTD
ncbi:MAG: SDR family NAD(P)-dependent oxidoreductase [Planctomycetota bacterium]